MEKEVSKAEGILKNWWEVYSLPQKGREEFDATFPWALISRFYPGINFWNLTYSGMIVLCERAKEWMKF